MNPTAIEVERPLSYEEERGKPMPSFNHAIIQMNLGIELARNRDYRVASELDIELGGKPMTPDLSVYRRQELDLIHDVPRRTDPPLLIAEILSASQSLQ